MTYILFLGICLLLEWICKKNNLDLPDDSVLQIIAILTAGEVISWRCKRG